jgi:hypothetical protein
VDQAIEAVEEEADVFLVGREGKDDGEVSGEAGEGFDVAGNYWRRLLVRLVSEVFVFMLTLGSAVVVVQDCG